MMPLDAFGGACGVSGGAGGDSGGAGGDSGGAGGDSGAADTAHRPVIAAKKTGFFRP